MRKKKFLVDILDEEINSIEINETWDLIDFIRDKNHIGVEWVNKSKLNEKVKLRDTREY